MGRIVSENGKYSAAELLSGVGEGKIVEYQENGNKRCEGYMKDGQREGLWKFYYENAYILLPK